MVDQHHGDACFALAWSGFFRLAAAAFDHQEQWQILHLGQIVNQAMRGLIRVVACRAAQDDP